MLILWVFFCFPFFISHSHILSISVVHRVIKWIAINVWSMQWIHFPVYWRYWAFVNNVLSSVLFSSCIYHLAFIIIIIIIIDTLSKQWNVKKSDFSMDRLHGIHSHLISWTPFYNICIFWFFSSRFVSGFICIHFISFIVWIHSDIPTCGKSFFFKLNTIIIRFSPHSCLLAIGILYINRWYKWNLKPNEF